MKHNLLLLLIASALAHASLGQIVVDLPFVSQKAISAQTIGITDITVEYSRPAINGRKVWGGLVPYGFNSPTFAGPSNAPWRAGANWNTTLSISHDAKIEGKDVKAGKYGFFVAVNENNTATIILSRENGAWGSFSYNPEEDALRVTVETKSIEEVELLTFSFDTVQPQSAILSLKWANKEIPIRLEVDVNATVIASLKEQFKRPVTFSWQSHAQAAAYLLGSNGSIPIASQRANLELALQWANESIYGLPQAPGEKNFITLSTKSTILFMLDSISQSREALAEALKNPGNATLPVVNGYGRSLITAKRNDDALTVYTWMLKQWPDNWASKHGMARALSANGKYKEAIKFETEAHAKAPDSMKKQLEGFIELLKQGKDFN
jgi:tetratricopeptide (TPR) repeat protein